MKTITYREVKKLTKERLFEAIDKSLEFAKENLFVTKNEFNSSLAKDLAGKSLEKCSGNRRKKLNKILSRLDYKLSRRTINIFFHFLNKKMETNMPLKFECSTQEQKVIDSRKRFKDLVEQTNKARTEYKDLKKGYYGSGKKQTEYVEI